MPTDYPGPGDEWQARIQQLQRDKERGELDRAMRLQGMAARKAARLLREEAAAKAFRNWPGPRTRR